MDRYLEVVEEAQPRPAWRRSSSISSSFTRVARFACEQGHDYGRDALQMWVEKQWPYGRRMQDALAECEQLLAAAKASGNAEYFLALLDQGAPQDEVLRPLLKSEVRESLSDQERHDVARRIVHRGLLTEEDDERRFVIIVSLRALSGGDFGYGLFAPPERNAKAIERWNQWAGPE